MKDRSFIDSLNDAVEGFLYVIRNERNMRVHFLFAFFVMLVAVFVGVNRVEWIVLSTVVTLVLVAEMINTAIEETMDLIKSEYHPIARVVKHISAGVVLVTVGNSLIVGFFIFMRYLKEPFVSFANGVHYASWHLMLISMIATIFLVIAGKTFFGGGTPFRGGPISGHSAVAFSLWTAVLFTHPNRFAVAATFLLAAYVARTRLTAKIHSLFEVLAGAVTGMAVTALFFKLFYR